MIADGPFAAAKSRDGKETYRDAIKAEIWFRIRYFKQHHRTAERPHETEGENR